MRLLDEDGGKRLERVILYLTQSEAEQLKNDLEQLLLKPSQYHAHVSGDDYQKEVTVTIYQPGQLEGFEERSKKLILEDI